MPGNPKVASDQPGPKDTRTLRCYIDGSVLRFDPNGRTGAEVYCEQAAHKWPNAWEAMNRGA